MAGREPTVLILPDYTDVNPYQRQLAAALEERGASVTVAAPADSLLPVFTATTSGETPDVLHLHFLSQFVLAAPRLPGPAVAPVSVLLSLRFLLEVTLLKLLGVSVVWTVHDLQSHERVAPRVELAARSLFARRLADSIFLHCDRARSDVAAAYRLPERARERMTVVQHGNFGDAYPDDTGRAAAREALELPEEAFVYTFFGSVKRYKNVGSLVRAFRSQDAPDARLLVAGDPATDRLREEVAAAAAEDDRIRTRLERVPDAAVQLYMNAADVVVLPFRTEPRTLLTSGSVWLAMRFGRPVVAPAIGCNPEMLGDGGLLYGTERTLPEALRAARSADLDAMGRRNSRRVADASWDRVAGRTLSVYRRVRDRAVRGYARHNKPR